MVMLAQLARRDATQATLDHFKDQPFHWGRRDCVRLAAWHLRRMGRRVSLVKAGGYGSEAGALRALKRAGFDDLTAAVDGQGLARIAPAAALTGDLVALTGEGPWPAITVALGNGRVLGFHSGFCRVLRPLDLVTAWRVEPCRR